MALTFSEKALIVSDFFEFYSEDYPELIARYNIGFPLAFALSYEGVEALTLLGKDWITEAYEALCRTFGVDVYGEYADLNELLEISEYPNAEG